MRILHISDFHISGNDVEQNKNILISENLIKKVAQIHAERNIDLIIFTGMLFLKEGLNSIAYKKLSMRSKFILWSLCWKH